MFKNYELPEDDVKHMPLENVIISFNSDLNQLWRLTIDRNYACDSIYEWFMMWDNIRRSYVKYIKLCKDILSVRLNGKPISKTVRKRYDECFNEISGYNENQKGYPVQIPEEDETDNIEQEFLRYKKYFISMNNFAYQFTNVIGRRDIAKVAVINLLEAADRQQEMQDWFKEKVENVIIYPYDYDELCREEKHISELLDFCIYYLEKPNIRNFYPIMAKDWIQKKFSYERKQLSERMKACEAGNIKYIYPIDEYRKGTLRTFPLALVGDFNFGQQDNEEMGVFLFSFLPLLETDYQYIVVLFLNTEYTVKYGLKISRDFISNVGQLLTGEQEELSMKNIFPLTSQDCSCYLKCFDLVINLEEQKENYELGSLYFGLWKYSIYKQYYDENNKKQKERLNEEKNVVENLFVRFLKNNENFMRDQLLELKRKVFEEDYILTEEAVNQFILMQTRFSE